MSDLTSNNPEDDSPDDSDPNKSKYSQYEFISSYIDGELTNDPEAENIIKLIETNNDFHNRYVFEKLTKEKLQESSKRIETPVYLYKNIGQGISDYISKASISNKPPIKLHTDSIGTPEVYKGSNLRRNLLISSAVFVLLIVSAFLFNSMLVKNPELLDNDLVSVSRNVFEKFKSGKLKLQYESHSSKELSDSLNKVLNFKVFIPEVKDAVLIGGTFDEVNGEKLAHFIHIKGNVIIYTVQASKKDIMNNIDKIVLCDQFKQSVNEGKNWFACLKEKNHTAVIWYRDNVICSSVSELEETDITSTLTNFK